MGDIGRARARLCRPFKASSFIGPAWTGTLPQAPIARPFGAKSPPAAGKIRECPHGFRLQCEKSLVPPSSAPPRQPTGESGMSRLLPLVILACALTNSAPADQLVIAPSDIALTGPQASQ